MWRRVHAPGSVRVRAAVAAAIIVGAAFSASSVVVVGVLRSSLYTSATQSARAEALDIASFISTRGRVPRRLPVTASEMAAQVVDAGGAVVAASEDVSGLPAMVTLSQAPRSMDARRDVIVRLHLARLRSVDLDYRFVVATVPFRSAALSGVVLVANSLGASDHAVDLVEEILAIVLPILVLLAGALVWRLTGWALRPVERIRAEVAELSATDLAHRVHEPTTRDEVGRLARTMNVMMARLESSAQRQRQLVADVAHELRNPLAALRAQLEVAIVQPHEEHHSLLQGSVVDVDRMTQLVNDLLTLARIDEGMMSARSDEVDLDDLALERAGELERRGRVAVSVHGVGAARLRSDEAQLRRVLANLADNAERHARHAVSFGVRSERDAVLLEVVDDGPGVPADKREAVFERFVRLEDARSHHGSGAGLGLAIVREIVRGLDGEVWVEDASPGARFVVRLPREPARGR